MKSNLPSRQEDKLATPSKQPPTPAGKRRARRATKQPAKADSNKAQATPRPPVKKARAFIVSDDGTLGYDRTPAEIADALRATDADLKRIGEQETAIQKAFTRRVENRWPLQLTHAFHHSGDGLPLLDCCALLALGMVRTEALWQELAEIVRAHDHEINGWPPPAVAAEIGAALRMSVEIVRRRCLRAAHAGAEQEEGLSLPMLPGLAGLAQYTWDDVVCFLAGTYVRNGEEVRGWLIPRVKESTLRAELAEALMIAEHVAASYLMDTDLNDHVGNFADPTLIQREAWSAMALAVQPCAGQPARFHEAALG